MNDIIACGLTIVMALIAIGCIQDKVAPMNFDRNRNEVISIHHTDDNLQGFSHSEGVKIHWAGNTSSGAQTLDVINVTIARMQFEQDTDELASDINARALAHLMQARQELEGKTTTTEDGLPILE